MEYYYLGTVSWEDSQMLYHAMAHLGREAVILLLPGSPYVCLGYHQDAQQEIDLAFARQNRLPVLRREVGGGAVYLDGGQLFYQIILRKDHPSVPADKASFYRKFLEPVAETYREFGVAAEFKPVNDIVANGRKVSGNGAGEIEGMVVLVGNFILDFNYEMMSKVLRVPDEKFRDKVYKTLQENLSTFKREIGKIPNAADLAQSLKQRLEPLVGTFEERQTIDAELRLKANALLAEMYTPEWLLANDRRRKEPSTVKIRDGVFVLQKVSKLPGGLVRISAVVMEGYLQDVHISGDFFIYPRAALQQVEQVLEGVRLDMDALSQTLGRFYLQTGVETPGITPQDLACVLLS